MWKYVQSIPASKLVKIMTKLKNGEYRFIIPIDKIIYFATGDTFGEVIPSDLPLNTEIQVWCKEA